MKKIWIAVLAGAGLISGSWAQTSVTILNEDFSTSEAYVTGDLAGQHSWMAITGSGTSAFTVDPAADGFADTEPGLASWDPINGNHVAWNTTTANDTNATWTGYVDFELNADALPGLFVTNTVYDIDPPNAIIGTTTNAVGQSKNLEHIAFELGLTPNTVDPLSASSPDQLTIQLAMNIGYSIIARLDASNNDRPLASLSAGNCGWDPRWATISNSMESAPDFTTDKIRLSYTIQKSAGNGVYMVSASFSNLVSGAVSTDDVTIERQEQGAYDPSLLFFAMGKSAKASDADRANVDIKIDAVALDHDPDAAPLIAAPIWAFDPIVGSDGQLDLTWESSLAVTEYNVYRSVTDGGPYAQIASVTNTSSYTDTDVNNLWTYYYVLRAVVDGNESELSEQASGMPLPTNTILTLTGEGGLLRTGVPNESDKWLFDGVLYPGSDTLWVTNILETGVSISGDWIGKPLHNLISYHQGDMKISRVWFNSPQYIDFNFQADTPAIAHLSYVVSTNFDSASASVDLSASAFSYELVIQQESDVAGETSRISAAVRQNNTWYCSVLSRSTAGILAIEDLGAADVQWQILDTTVGSNKMSLAGVPANTVTLNAVDAIGWYVENSRLTKINNLSVENTDLSAFTGYDWWKAEYLLTSPDGDPSSDPDLDGFNNIWEYGLGGDPMDPENQGTLPTMDMTNVAGTDYLRFIYLKRKDESAGLQYYLENANNLSNQSFTNDTDYAVMPLGDVNADFYAVTNLIPTVDSQTFIRLQIEQN